MGTMSERFEMRVDEDIVSRVDKWRHRQSERPSRAEAFRRLVEIGLAKVNSKAVHFSDGEKLLAIMLRDVYRHLKIEGEIDADFISDVIYGGHYWAPKWNLGCLFTDHEDDARDVKFVVDVLDMWDFVESGYERLSKKDKDRLEKEAAPLRKRVKFLGFDGNNEIHHLSIAQFLVEKMGKWSRFKGRVVNSHFQTLSLYQRMLAVFEPIRANLIGVGLDADQLIQILNAKKLDS